MTSSGTIVSTRYLVAVSIGPVQEFIAAARKTRDLWAGSDLLSHISKAVAEEVQKDGVAKLVFPSPDLLMEDSASVANKLLLEVTQGNPEDIARKVKADAQNALRGVWEGWKTKPDNKKVAVWQEACNLNLIDETRLARHLNDFLEVNVAWISYDPDAPANDEISYQNRRDKVEKLLAGRKSLRDFAPAKRDDDGIPKSSLDPARETVFNAEAFRALDEDAARKIHRELRLKLNEQLDGISVIKRLTGENRLVSLARVAVDPYLRAIAETEELNPKLETLRSLAGDLNHTSLVERFRTGHDSGLYHYRHFPYDSQLFYDKDASEAAVQLIKDIGTAKKDTEANAPGAISIEESNTLGEFFKCLQEIRDARIGAPPTDVAILVADGDRIGAALSEIDSADQHREFSTKLVAFARDAVEIVTMHYGAMIYTGGDDVLAFLPADTAIPCAWALKKAFSAVMAKALPDVAEDERPTLSVGVAIGHYSEHLQVLLQRGRDAEKDAKKDRNALSVSYQARSGGGVRISRRSWSAQPVENIWSPLVYGFINGEIPHGFLYELDNLRIELHGTYRSATEAWVLPPGLIAQEVNRILDRKRVDSGQGQVSDAIRKQILGYFDDRASAQEQLTRMGMLVNELYIARKLAPAIRLAHATADERWEVAKDGVDQKRQSQSEEGRN